MTRTRLAIVLLAPLLGALASCAAPVATRPVPAASIATEGVEIRAADGTFAFEAGRAFEPPFFGRCYNLSSGDERALEPSSLVQGASVGASLGARRVEVRVPGRDAPLLGLLLFCEAPTTTIGPASRSYRLTVPESYVAEASGGRVSVMYERVRRRSNDGSERWWYGWVLWLSDQPFL